MLRAITLLFFVECIRIDPTTTGLLPPTNHRSYHFCATTVAATTAASTTTTTTHRGPRPETPDGGQQASRTVVPSKARTHSPVVTSHSLHDLSVEPVAMQFMLGFDHVHVRQMAFDGNDVICRVHVSRSGEQQSSVPHRAGRAERAPASGIAWQVLVQSYGEEGAPILVISSTLSSTFSI